jgi:hypothetical protein
VVAEPAPPQSDPGEIRTRLERWRGSGESALVVDHLLTVLPDDAATAEWRARVESIRFDPGERATLDRYVAEGLQLFDQQRRSR